MPAHTATLKIIEGGRVTIPATVRELENIKEGDWVRITVEKVGTTEHGKDRD